MAWVLAASGGAWAQEATLAVVEAKVKEAKDQTAVVDGKTNGLTGVVAALLQRVAALEAGMAATQGQCDSLGAENALLWDYISDFEGRIAALEENGGGSGDPAVLAELQTDVQVLQGRTCGLTAFGVCNDTCMEYSANDQNCGSCGNACGYHEGCYQGECVPASSLGWDMNGYFESYCRSFESISMEEWERACYDDTEWWPSHLAAYRTTAVDVLQTMNYGCPEGQFSSWYVSCWKVGAGDWVTDARLYWGL